MSLEPTAGSEMRYHRVRADPQALVGHWGGICPGPMLDFLPPQKLTWRSNQHDISICRMKGKHEVWGGSIQAL